MTRTDETAPPPGRKSKTHRVGQRPPFDCVALVLQGGGALGAYQGGVYQGLAEAGLHPDWVAGISIGAINAALIAGNPPEARVARLREFWELITTNPRGGWLDAFGSSLGRGDLARGAFSQIAAANALMNGAPGFFSPRQPNPWFHPTGTPEATSYYDTTPLKATLERLVDFDRINAPGQMQFSVGAVNVRTGNFAYFNSRTHHIRAEHIMASGALPPGFPAVEIDGEPYWDGGLVSNTPLEWVTEREGHRDMLIFQVDLWNARGEDPTTVANVLSREKEIRFSSRTRAATNAVRRRRRLGSALATLLERLPPDLKAGPEMGVLEDAADLSVYNIIQLIHRARTFEHASKDYEFSRATMEEHWAAGYHDAIRTLRHPEVLQRPATLDGVFTFDLAVDGRE
ncbi:patatin-like phospholipase family protein [Nitrospirillum sp. BR 11163]|uniref:patatin-like phospholipase family protein n=1 Tax=Nitrospirillum sp. BR 11163 TaxID=3104323 RepID=UPI002AFF33D6|nr:patatin-like phospholipase family protein [Nitrospirillum sp. BR 11163]MEA1676031.1 patatin-like phospholipase family protein [Nitrospirillum sp. BR 11163]